MKKMVVPPPLSSLSSLSSLSFVLSYLQPFKMGIISLTFNLIFIIAFLVVLTIADTDTFAERYIDLDKGIADRYDNTTKDSGRIPKRSTDRCTTIIVGKDASIDGSTMTTHTNDCGECDFRLAKVNPKKYQNGSKRSIYTFYSAYPKVVRDDDRSFTWSPENLDKTLDHNMLREWTSGSFHHINGYIDQVNSTYGIVEGIYGIMNDQQLAIGESTCGAKFWSKPIYAGGSALFEIAELSQIALERCRTARCAIELMGGLAEKYGYYGASWDDNDIEMNIIEAGEALTLADPYETWMFHIVPDDTGTSAVWCAQRVPDDHISVVANIFVIQEIDPSLQGQKFLYSKNIFKVAQRNNLWSRASGKLLNFRDTFGIKRDHIYYGTRRVWRVFTVLSKGSINLDPIVHELGEIPNYPFSIPISYDNKLSVQDLMAIQRDHFEGTDFDLTKGIAAGPYGNPNRWDPSELSARNGNVTQLEAATGSYDRSIALFRASYVTVTTSRASLPNDIGARVFVAQYMASMSSFLPIYVAMESLPEVMTTGSLYRYSSASNWWNMAVVGNWATRFYMYIRKDVEKVQREVENQMFNELERIESQYETKGFDEKIKEKEELEEEQNQEHEHATVVEGVVDGLEEGVNNLNVFNSHVDGLDTFSSSSSSSFLSPFSSSSSSSSPTQEILSQLATFSNQHATYVSQRWLDLFHILIAKYRDGYQVVSFSDPTFQQNYLFYPKSWLQVSGFFDRSEAPTIKVNNEEDKEEEQNGEEEEVRVALGQKQSLFRPTKANANADTKTEKNFDWNVRQKNVNANGMESAKKEFHKTIEEINESDPGGAKKVEINSVIFTLFVSFMITFVVGYLCFQWGYQLGKQASGFAPI